LRLATLHVLVRWSNAPGVRYFGHWLEYNEAAAKDAEEKVRAFLAAHLAETSPGEPTKK
jgi:dienelactone hydrolase